MDASVYLKKNDVALSAVDVDIDRTKFEIKEMYEFITIGNILVQREQIQAIEFGN